MTTDLGRSNESMHVHADAAEGWLAVDAGTVARSGSCGRRIRPGAGPAVLLADREVCEYWPIAGQRVLREPHCCLPHTVCTLVPIFSNRGSKPARVEGSSDGSDPHGRGIRSADG